MRLDLERLEAAALCLAFLAVCAWAFAGQRYEQWMRPRPSLACAKCGVTMSWSRDGHLVHTCGRP